MGWCFLCSFPGMRARGWESGTPGSCPAAELPCEPGPSPGEGWGGRGAWGRQPYLGTALPSLCPPTACPPVPGSRLHWLSCPGGPGQGRSDRDVQVKQDRADAHVGSQWSLLDVCGCLGDVILHLCHPLPSASTWFLACVHQWEPFSGALTAPPCMPAGSSEGHGWCELLSGCPALGPGFRPRVTGGVSAPSPSTRAHT